MSLLGDLAEGAAEKAADKAFDHFDKNEERKEKNRTKNDSTGKKVARGAGNFALGLVMLLLALAINALLIYGVFINPFDEGIFVVIGIVSVVYALLCFIIPALRHISFVRWLGILALGDAVWAFKCMMG